MRDDVADLFRGLGQPGFRYRECVAEAERWRARRALFPALGEPDSNRTTPAPRLARAVFTLAVSNLSPGAGATTVASEVASVLASGARRTLAVSACEDDRFEARMAAPTRLQLAWPASSGAVAQGRLELARTSLLATLALRPAPLADARDLGDCLASLVPPGWDDVVVDAGAEGGEAWAFADVSLCVVPADDVAGVCASGPLLRRLAADHCFVLNRYDAADPRQRELRSALEDLLGSALLPTVVHEDPAVRSARARGLPLALDAPGSQVLEDLRLVTAAVRARAPGQAPAAKRA